MNQTVEAVIEPNGTVRLLTPIHVTTPTRAVVTVMEAIVSPPLTREEALQRIKAARTFQAWREAANAAAALEPQTDYDLIQKLEENRKFSGWNRPLFRENDPEAGS